MTKRSIHIENLQIRLPHSAAGQAGNFAGGLGREILQGIGEATAGRTGTKKIDEISAGNIKISVGAGHVGLQKQIARRVSDEIRNRFE